MNWDAIAKLAAIVGLCTPVFTAALVVGRFFWKLDKKLDCVIQEQQKLFRGIQELLEGLVKGGKACQHF